MPTPAQAWQNEIPRTITNQKTNNQKSNSKRKTTTSTSDNDFDNKTTTTVETTVSYTQDMVSELQNASQQTSQQITDLLQTRQHQQLTIDSHTERLSALDSYIESKFSSLTQNMDSLEREQQTQQQQQEQFQTNLKTFSAKIPTLTDNLEKQQQQLLKYFRKQNKINRQLMADVQNLKQNQINQQTMISTLQAFMLSMQTTAPHTIKPAANTQTTKAQNTRRNTG
jgi:DNA repair exonuclease SbcCD ATPase subunit